METSTLDEPVLTEHPCNPFRYFDYCYNNDDNHIPHSEDSEYTHAIMHYICSAEISVDEVRTKKLFKMFQWYCIVNNIPLIDKINFAHYMHLLGYVTLYDPLIDGMVYSMAHSGAKKYH